MNTPRLCAWSSSQWSARLKSRIVSGEASTAAGTGGESAAAVEVATAEVADAVARALTGSAFCIAGGGNGTEAAVDADAGTTPASRS
ncbi:hypothetical protein GCM10025794_14720 [Massilia kyonggiensis]